VSSASPSSPPPRRRSSPRTRRRRRRRRPSPRRSRRSSWAAGGRLLRLQLQPDEPALRAFDVQHNAFSLSAAEVNFAKSRPREAGLASGPTSGSARRGLTAMFEPEQDGKEIYKHVQQAYVSVLTGRVQWDAGKFVTPHGAEVIESQDNWNYTRSILFGYAIRSTTSGAGHRAGVRQAEPQRVPGERLEQRGRDRRREDLRRRRDPEASGSLTWIATYMAARRRRTSTPGTSSTPRSPSPRPGR